MYSAKKIYLDNQLRQGNTDWPVKIVDPEIEDCYRERGLNAAEEKLLGALGQDYDASTPREEIERRPWFGRCVWESDNDVLDDQHVTLTWEDEPSTSEGEQASGPRGRGAKTASFHMIAHTEKQCERRGRIYGSKGEIEYDSKAIRVHEFGSGTRTYHPHQPGGGHGGGDEGLVSHFLQAVEAVKTGGMEVEQAQESFVGCSLQDMLRSHAMVFAAEEARKERKVVEWSEWWEREVRARVPHL